MTALRDEVVAAFEQHDELGIRRLGWWPVWEACATWWDKRHKASAKDMVPYAKLLGGVDPARVLSALEALAGDWRPSPAAIRGWLNDKASESNVDVGRGRARSGSPEALRAVAANGAEPCTCGRLPVVENGSPRFPRWLVSPDHVWRCEACDGIEQGQCYAAEDAGLLSDPAPADAAGAEPA